MALDEELLRPGQWIEVVSAPKWPHLVGVRATIKEVIERSILGGGPAYVLNLFTDGDAPFLASPTQVRWVPELEPIKIPEKERQWFVVIQQGRKPHEGTVSMEGDLVTVTYAGYQKRAALDGLVLGRRAEAILREIVEHIQKR